MSCTASSTTMPSEISVVYSRNAPLLAPPRQILNVAFISKRTANEREYPRMQENIHVHVGIRVHSRSFAVKTLFSFHFLDNRFQIIRHFWHLLQPNLYRAIRCLRNDGIYFGETLILLRIILAELRAAAFLSFQRRPGYRFGNGQQVFQIECGVPPWIELAIPAYTNPTRLLP